MILVPRRLVTSVTKSLNVQLGSDVDTPTAWAVVVEDTEGNEPTGHTVAVDSDGVLTGQLPQGEYGLQLTATLPDSTTEHGSLVVESVRDLTVRYDDVEAPVGSLVPLAPRLWNHRRPVTFRDVGLGADDVLDTATGAVTIKADVDREATVSVIDDRGEAALGTISVKATANTVAASFRTSRRYVAAGDSIFEPVTVTGGTGPYVLTFEAAPDWALLEEAEVRGVVAEGGLIRVKATDAAGNSDTADIWLEVEQAPGLFLTIPSLDGPGNRKMPEGVRCIVEGGTAPFAFTLEDGPAGLTLDGETGEFGGDRPPLAGSYPVRVSVLDDAGQRAFASRVMEVPTPVFAITFEDIVVQANTLVRRQPTANAPVLRWSKESGPAWLSVVSSGGQVRGRAPSSPQESVLRLFAEAQNGQVARRDVRVRVLGQAPACTIPAVRAQRGTAGSVNMAVTNSGAGWTARKMSGPAWLNVSSSGRVSWGALASTDTDVTPLVVQVTRTADSAQATCTVTPTIRDAPRVGCSFANVPGTLRFSDGPSNVTVNISAGNGPWTLVLRQLPGPRLRVRSSTTVTVRESFPSRTFSIEAQDTGIVRLQADITASDGSTFVCNTQVRAIGAADAPLTCAESPSFSVVPGRTFSRDIPAASGGSGGNRYTKLTGPTWLNVSSAGTVSGTAPSDSGSFSWSYRVTDSSGSICDGRAGTVRVRTVAASTLVCGSAPAIAAQVGTAFSATIPEATGGVGSKTYSLNTGAPSWLSLSGRTLSGTAPSSAGSFSYSYTATDSATPASTCTSSATITITTGTPTLTCSAAPSFSVRAEEAFSTVIPQVSGGRGPFRFALNTGAPSWLRLTGRTLRGTAPSSTGAYSYGYTVTDADDSTCTASGTITVTAPPLSCEPAPSFAVTTGGVFSMQITVPSGGSGNVTFTKVSGPAWLNISTSGLVSGTAPATAGEHPYVYQASDGTDTCRGNGIASVVVQNIQCAAVPNITASINRSFTGTIPNATAGRGLKSYRKESGAAWITISGQTVSGTAPTTAGTYNYSYRASDLTGSCTGAGRIIVSDPSQPLSVRLEPADARGLLDTSLEVTAVATGGQPPYTYSKKAGSSDQVTVHSDGRVVLAAQSTAGTFSYTVVATDSATPTAATAEAAGTFTVSDKAPLEFDDIDIRLAQPNVPIVRWEIHPFIKGGKEPYTVTFVGTPPTGYVARTRSIGNPVDGFVDRWYLEFPGPGEFEDISLQLRVTDADNDSAISNVTVRVQDLTVWAYTNRVAVGSIGFIPLGAGGRGAGSAYTRVAVAPGSEETVRKAPGGINGLRTAPRFIGQGFDYSLDILSSVDDTVIGTFVYGYTTVGSFQVTGTTAVQRGTTTAWTISVTPHSLTSAHKAGVQAYPRPQLD